MRLPLVLHVCGVLVRPFGAMFAVPLLVALHYGEYHPARGFAVAGVVTVAVGHLLRRAGGPAAEAAVERMRRVEGFATVAAAWLLIAHAAAIPFLWTGFGFIDALFEAMSGLTTTGASVIRDFAAIPRSIFMWRALTCWLGGMGVIALFVAILPRLAVGGREIFFAEAAGPEDEKVTPQIRRTALVLWQLYAAISLVMVLALYAAGMPLFDAVCNMMATMAAAGFSPHPASIGGYQNPAAEWVTIVFMFVAGANFALQYRAIVSRNPRLLANDEEFRVYTGIVIAASLALAFALGWADGALGTTRTALFQVLSIMTTTGFASTDFNLWNDRARFILLALMFVGACAGSTGGGPKVVRYMLLLRYAWQELRRTLHPRAVLPVKLGGRVVPDEVMRNVLVFFLFYVATFAICTAIVVAFGLDMMTGISAAIATLGNVGPGFNQVGPMGHFADLHPVSRVTLTLAMWIGRLEVLTVLVVLRLEPWRDATVKV
jgi:trk system potassium uptake protein TrkH